MNSDWKILSNVAQLEQITKDSFNKPAVLFKHSTRCGISHGAMDALETKWSFKADDMDFYYLDLIAHRDISNEIAKRFDVMHQSPQIIVLKDGKATFTNSHHAIGVEKIKEAIA